MKLDKKDHQILAILQQDARRSISSIAREVHLARATVQERIHKLEQGKVIKGYHISTDNSLIFGEQIQAMIRVTIDSNHFDQTVDFIKALPQITRCCAISGQADLMIEVSVKTISELDQLLADIGQQQGVAQTQSDILLKSF